LNREKLFDYIFRNNMWGGEASRSGIGSSSIETEQLRREIPALLRRVGATSLLDIPCGDFNWMCELPLDGVRYIGADIVPDIVERNRQKFGDIKGVREFTRLDMVSDPLPRADVVLCRDCLVHLSFDNIRAALSNLVASGSTFLLATTFYDHKVNADIEDGDWRMLNLERPPFSFPPATALIVEGAAEGGGAYGDKSLGLWRIGDLA
jgi:hypothetical protein